MPARGGNWIVPLDPVVNERGNMRVTLAMSPELRQRIGYAAIEHDRTPSSLMRAILKKWIDHYYPEDD